MKWSLIIVAGILGLPMTAFAQDRGSAPRVVQLESFEPIQGRPPRPRAFYILNRNDQKYEVLDLRTSFVREIVRTTQGEPFSN